ncbi:MAG TPA: hypothetical protein PLY87_08805 [Planctomycetaceae bacterium]|nr:hypothetical protein [Planctomycetaceae bacterium]
MKQQQQQVNFFPLILIVAVGFLMFRSVGSSPDPSPPIPEPVPVVASEHLTAALEYSAALQQHIKATITRLEMGELTDETSTRDFLKLGREASLKAAWMPVAERDAAAFSDGWTVEKQVARLEALIAPGAGN